jgi:3-oxoacyl-[acyl-carrier protein] reductase
MIDLSGRVAIVTGASRGIGRAIARRLAVQGAHVVAAARGDNARPVAEEITAEGGRADAVALDVTEAGAAGAVVANTLERLGRIDILVNNAGITRDQLMLRMKREDWDAVLATNLTGAFALTQAVLKPMVRQRSGRIGGITVNVVAPGLVETDMTRELTGDAREEWASKIPLRRLGTPDDIASAVCFLASDEASYITGQVLAVNGGMYT